MRLKSSTNKNPVDLYNYSGIDQTWSSILRLYETTVQNPDSSNSLFLKDPKCQFCQ